MKVLRGVFELAKFHTHTVEPDTLSAELLQRPFLRPVSHPPVTK